LTERDFAANVARVTGASGWIRGRLAGARLALLAAGSALACTPEARPLPEVPDGPGAQAALEQSAQAGWSYQGATGPDKWASLSPDWAACSEAGQSPIDLPLDGLAAPAAAPGLAVGLELPPAALTLRAIGEVVSLSGTPTPVLVLDGTRAMIESVEVHVPAEHSLNEATFDAELVFVAKGAGDRPILLSFLYRTGAANVALDPLLAQFPKGRVSGELKLSGQLALAGLVPASAQLLAYDGSLSVPPCTTGVQRLVVAQVGELSTEQLAHLRQAVPRSARPTSPRGERTVTVRPFSSNPAATATTPPAP
jgi:carbonic anhydrase